MPPGYLRSNTLPMTTQEQGLQELENAKHYMRLAVECQTKAEKLLSGPGKKVKVKEYDFSAEIAKRHAKKLRKSA